jgi:hypothetical protein
MNWLLSQTFRETTPILNCTYRVFLWFSVLVDTCFGWGEVMSIRRDCITWRWARWCEFCTSICENLLGATLLSAGGLTAPCSLSDNITCSGDPMRPLLALSRRLCAAPNMIVAAWFNVRSVCWHFFRTDVTVVWHWRHWIYSTTLFKLSPRRILFLDVG